MHTLDELVEIQIKFVLQSIFCLLLKGNHSLFSVSYNMYNESFNMVSVRFFFIHSTMSGMLTGRSLFTV